MFTQSKINSTTVSFEKKPDVFERLYKENKTLKAKKKQNLFKYNEELTKDLFKPNLKNYEQEKLCYTNFNLNQSLKLYSQHIKDLKIGTTPEKSNKTTISNSVTKFALSDSKLKRSTINSTSSKMSVSKKEGMEITTRIYEKGVNFKQNKQNRIVETIMKNNNEEPIYSFKPDITISQKKNLSLPKNFSDRVLNWIKVKQNKREKLNLENENKYKDCHSFRPEINNSIMKDDEEFVKLKKREMNTYVKKRREIIRSASMDNMTEMRQMSIGSTREIRNTQLESSDKFARFYDNSNKKDRLYFAHESPMRVLNQRKFLGTQDFFDNAFAFD